MDIQNARDRITHAGCAHCRASIFRADLLWKRSGRARESVRWWVRQCLRFRCGTPALIRAHEHCPVAIRHYDQPVSLTEWLRSRLGVVSPEERKGISLSREDALELPAPRDLALLKVAEFGAVDVLSVLVTAHLTNRRSC